MLHLTPPEGVCVLRTLLRVVGVVGLAAVLILAMACLAAVLALVLGSTGGI